VERFVSGAAHRSLSFRRRCAMVTGVTTTDQLALLDKLILDHTSAPVTVKLRNQLSIVIQEIEALQADHFALKNDHSVLKNLSMDKIANLQKENENLVAANSALNATLKASDFPSPRGFKEWERAPRPIDDCRTH
jgi:hypothetical protein